MICRSILSTMRGTGAPLVYRQGDSHAFALAACVTGGGPSFYRGQSRQFELCWFVTHSVGVRAARPEFQVRFR